MATAAAASAASAAVATGRLFNYNRENFLVDREARMRMEFAVRGFREQQGRLWREDVRAFVSLTERKMCIYLLVNVLMLGFTLNLWCEGHLPHSAPGWLIMGNQVAIAGAFAFLLLTVWMAVHAAVAAQAYEARILTQLVRLPLPTWQELEACRTYASDFEKVGARQMLRVPFLQGWQESMVEPCEPSSEPSSPVSAGSPCFSAASTACPAEAMAADPWGLERDGEAIYELGTYEGSEVARLRHMRLVRQAAVYWQSYDAFARVSMSMGVCQLMLAMSYFVLGQGILQAKAPLPSFAGVAVLMGAAEMVAKIDLTLPAWEQRLVQGLMLLGPAVISLSTYLWALHSDLSARLAESLAPAAFISHGAVIMMLTTALQVKEQENGAMLPLAYRGVLFLDVFGWVRHEEPCFMPKEAKGEAPEARPSATMISNMPRRPEDLAQSEDCRAMPGAAQCWDKVDAVEPPAKEFWEAATFMPEERRERRLMDEEILDIPCGGLPEKEESQEGWRMRDDVRLETGHDEEAPGILPWRVVRMTAIVTSSIWLVAGFYCLLQVAEIWRFHLPWWWEVPALAASTEDWRRWRHRPPPPLELQLAATWPFPTLLPESLACSENTLLASDGLGLFAATPAAPAFKALPPCVRGEAIEDVALLCTEANCSALVLHRRGKRLASCPLAGGGSALLHLARTWLQPHEEISSLLVDPGCHATSPTTGCVWAGTSRGRAVRLHGSADGRQLVPAGAELEGAPVEAVLRFDEGKSLAALAKGQLSLKGQSLALPQARGGFCLAGREAFWLGDGASLWRRPLPAAPGGRLRGER